MAQLLSFAMLAMAVLASPVPRDVTSVLADLTTVDTAATDLTATTTAWDGSADGAGAVVAAVSTLQADIVTGTTDAAAETVLSSDDSQSVLTYVEGTLGPDFSATLAELVAREDDIAAIGATADVAGSLGDLKDDVDAYGAALIAITSSDLQTEAQAAVDAIDALLDSAIAAFS